MEQTVKLRVLIDEEITKLTLNDGILSTVNELVDAIKSAYSITTDISLLYKDKDFDDFFTLTSTDDLRDKDTLKVVNVPQMLTLTIVPQEEIPDIFDVCSQHSVDTVDSYDTLILSPSPSEMQDPWPTVFCIPTSSHNTELTLRQGNEINK